MKNKLPYWLQGALYAVVIKLLVYYVVVTSLIVISQKSGSLSATGSGLIYSIVGFITFFTDYSMVVWIFVGAIIGYLYSIYKNKQKTPQI
jgi:hypothetical protein